MNASPNIVIVNGSTRDGSHTRGIATRSAELLEERGAVVRLLDVRDFVLPPADPVYHGQPEHHYNGRVREMTALFDQADGVVLASPVYHGSCSGVLKNLLDHLRWDAFRGRPVSFLVHGGGHLAGSSVCDHLRVIVRTMQGYGTQTQVITSDRDFSAGRDKPPAIDDDIEARLVRMADELVWLARALRPPAMPMAVGQ